MNLLLLFVQIAVVLVAARMVGALFRRLQQPQVVGEMAAGIILGPSLLGWLAPEIAARLFPAASLVHLGTLSQIGLVLFMFLVGLEFDPRLLRGRGEAALLTSHVSIVAPFFLGSLLALHLYPRLSDASVGFDGFALFLGAAMSVTAFPVLARILQERNLTRTRVGAVAIACAAVDDVTAWAILAVVVAVVRASALHAPLWVTLAGSAAYVAFMILVARPALRLFEKRHQATGRLSQDALALLLLLVLASAYTTEWLGIHALFGAFLLGAVMPKDRGLVHDITEKLEHVTVVFFLPLFFAAAGLKTRIGLVAGAEMWGYFGLIMLVAVAGKFGGSAIAARVTGLGWRESAAVGTLMNTRGLMELVILTIGLEIGVISPALFAMMVMMALATTLMTTPLLQLILPDRLIRASQAEAREPDEFTVVIPVGVPASGPGLLAVASSLVPEKRRSRLYGVHLRRPVEGGAVVLDTPIPNHDETLQPLLQAAEMRGESVRPVVMTSRRLGRDIADLARLKSADLVVMGWHKPVVAGGILGGAVQEVFERAPTDVAVYVERSFAPWQRILVPYRGGAHDRAALDLAKRIAARRGIPLTVLRVVAGRSPEPHAPPPALDEPGIASVRVVATEDGLGAVVKETVVGGHDLVVVGVAKEWGLTTSPFGARHQRLARETQANLLVVRTRGSDAPQEAGTPAPAPAVEAATAA